MSYYHSARSTKDREVAVLSNAAIRRSEPGSYSRVVDTRSQAGTEPKLIVPSVPNGYPSPEVQIAVRALVVDCGRTGAWVTISSQLQCATLRRIVDAKA